MLILRTSRRDPPHGTVENHATGALKRQGKFPTRIRLGLNSVGWRDEEVQNWVELGPGAV